MRHKIGGLYLNRQCSPYATTRRDTSNEEAAGIAGRAVPPRRQLNENEAGAQIPLIPIGQFMIIGPPSEKMS